MNKMNPQIKEKWVNALRSGNYEQNHDGRLRNENGYCCLGVLCDLYAKENDKEWGNYDAGSGEGYNFEDYNDFPPQSVIEWAGLSNENPAVEVVYDEEDEPFSDNEPLASLNDNGMSFNDIANLISSQL